MHYALSLLLLFQGLTGVTGKVIDPTGAVIPGVEITVTNTATGVSRSALTNETGNYTITQLPPGNYTVKAELAGFKAKVVNVPLPVDQTVTLDLPLEVGAVTDIVEVLATAETVNTVDAKLGVGFDQKKIIDLPLNARNIVGLLALQTGVTMSDKNVNNLEDRDNGGQVNGARNDQQNIVLDGVNINTQERGFALEGALPTTVDSVQEFIVQTAGYNGGSGRGSGAQIQLVTKSGSNNFHGSAYDYYRTTRTSAKNYFAAEPSHLLRHVLGGSMGGPIKKDKLFFFGTYERNTDRSAQVRTRTIPTPQFLDGIVRYQRKDGSFGRITDGPGGMLEKITLIPGDRWNSNMIGPNGILEKYRPFSTDAARTRSAAFDGGANALNYTFNSPFVRDRNVYISRLDFNLNAKNSFYWRGTLNDDTRTLAVNTFPGFNDARNRQDNSKGFAANWNDVITSNLNSNFSAGLTREAFADTGNSRAYFNVNTYDNPFQTTGASRQAINTWNFVENLSWIKGNHNVQFGANYRFIDNKLNSFDAVRPQVFSNPANLTGNEIGVASMPALRRALGDAEFAQVRSPGPPVGDALMNATGSVSLLSYDLQFDIKGRPISAGQPFVRDYALHEWDYFVQDSWRVKPSVTLTFGLNYQLQTPPYERNGIQVNWAQSLKVRWNTQKDSSKTIPQLPLYEAQAAGRANRLPDYYSMDTNNFAPRISFAWSPSVLPSLTKKGGPMVIRGGYSLTYDRIGGRLSRDAAIVGSVGLVTRIGTPGYSFSIDGDNGVARAARIGSGGALPFGAFPAPSVQQDFKLPQTTGGLGGVSTTGIDSSLHASPNSLVNLTISKELPGGWLVEGSYVGRFARQLLGQVDIASPVNYRDPISGMSYYEAVKQLIETYEHAGALPTAVQPIAYFENVYPEVRNYVNGKLRTNYTSATQAFYAYINQGVTPGRNAAFDIVDHMQLIEGDLKMPRLLNTQTQFFGLWSNLSRSNYNSGQLSVRKRFGQGYTMTVNYTYGKSLDTTSAAESLGNRAGNGLAIDPYRPELAYGLSNFDRRHQLNINSLVDLPFGRDKWIGRNVPAAVNHIIGGWQISGILVASSGRPFSFGAGNRFNLHYFGQDEPLMIKPTEFKLTKANGQVYMLPGTSADRQNVQLQNFQTLYPGGPIGRNQGHGPNYSNIDLALTKSFDITENVRTRLRAEAFNALNHPNFNLPSSTNIDGAAGSIGRITTTIGTERVMQFSFRIEF